MVPELVVGVGALAAICGRDTSCGPAGALRSGNQRQRGDGERTEHAAQQDATRRIEVPAVFTNGSALGRAEMLCMGSGLFSRLHPVVLGSGARLGAFASTSQPSGPMSWCDVPRHRLDVRVGQLVRHHGHHLVGIAVAPIRAESSSCLTRYCSCCPAKRGNSGGRPAPLSAWHEAHAGTGALPAMPWR